MMLSGKSIGLAGLLGLFGLTGCWSNGNEQRLSDSPHKTAPTQTDLIAFHKQRAEQLDSLMASVTQSWPGLERTGTGIHMEWLERDTTAVPVEALPKGTVLELHHKFTLLDDQVLTTWQDDGPLAFELGATDLPTGFHELVGQAFLGDSLRALIPPSRAWGMTGLPPDIPQEAIISVEMNIDLYRQPQ